MTGAPGLSPDAKRVLISVNPKAGASSTVEVAEELGQRLRDAGFFVDAYSDIDKLSLEAEQSLAANELRAVVGVGGDGTIALLANRTPEGTPLAMLPYGTENLLAKHLGITNDLATAVQTIKDGYAVRFDAGLAGDRLFLLMAGCGFDAEVVRRLHDERTGHIHHLSYAKPILDSIRTYEYPEIRVYCEDESEPITARWAFVVNLPRYAGGLQIAPKASGEDGLLDVCTFKEGSFWNGLRYLTGVMLGQHESWDDCVTVRASRVRIESDQPVPYQLDGDPGGFLPIQIEVVANRLTMLTPKPDVADDA